MDWSEQQSALIAAGNQKIEMHHQAMMPVSYTHLDVYKRQPERDSGLPDYIRESQRFSSLTIQDTISSFDPLADPNRDSGVYPHSQICRDSACSESSYYPTKSDDTILPLTSNIATPEVRSESSPQFQTESVVHRKREFGQQLQGKQPSLDSLDESSRLSGVSSASSSGERFSLLSTSSGEESAKNNDESTTPTKKGVKVPKFQKIRKQSLKNFTKEVFGSLSKKKSKQGIGKKTLSAEKMNEEVGERVAEYIEKIVLRRSHETGTFLCMTIDAFINSKVGKKHEKPEAMMHSIRQLIGGLKRNLIAMKADPVIQKAIQQNTDKLNQEVESIVEAALYQRILVPLKETIYSNYHHEYKRNGSILLLEEKMAAARSRTIEQLGIKTNFVPPNEEQMKTIKECFSCLQEAYSPYDKMDLILKAVTYIYDFVGDKEHGRAVQSMGADDFLPMLIYILVQCDMTTIEIETDYIWSLLEASAFTGEPAYYLTTLTSAIHVLKNVEYFDDDEQEEDKEENKEEDNANDEVAEEESMEFVHRRSSSVSGTKGFLEVVVTVTTGVFQDKMLPVWPGMSTKQICRNLALKNRIDEKDRENFGLFKLERNTDGQVIKETLLQDNDSPQRVKDEMAVKGVFCDFGFKHKFYRIDWPVNEKFIDKTNSDESDEEDTEIEL
ncbi:protein sprint-like [Anneissia japonica]|uniref:protein sprint-like n=1 Tax=Anneissia japonica TaxID=1529436 RepID=UPI001425B978|nr:protein sprint-like [Anneissia japonica]